MESEKTMLGDEAQSFIDVAWLEQPDPGVLYSNGLTLYEEVLYQERWIGRSWSPVGRPRLQATRNLALDEACPTPVHAFELEVDGQSLHYGWQWREAEEHPRPREGVRHVSVTLEHRVRPVRVRVHTRLDGTPCLMRWLEITNTGTIPAAMGHVAPMAGLLWRVGSWRRMDYRDLVEPFQGAPFSVGHFGENNALEEGDFIWESVPEGVLQLESRRGRAGHGAPFFILRHEGSGEHFIGHLGWSGNWLCQFTYAENRSLGDAAISFRMGPSAPSPMRVLAPGETILTPAVHLGYMTGDLDRCVQAMHTHLRRTVLPPQPEGRAQVVIGKGTGYMALGQHMSEERLKASIDVAAEIGCELYLIDAGWYQGSSGGWHETAGDWHAGEHLPNGLEPVFSYARDKGLLYGLWVEIERLGERSAQYREHPDWILTRYGKPIERGPLDMSKPEVVAWMEAEIIRIIEQYDLDLFRLDYNINIWEGGQTERDGFLENTQWRHYEALYALFERIRQKYPHVLLENCASGGGRSDVGILSQFHTTWISDWMALPRSAKILNGMTLALPPEYCNRMTGASMYGDLYGDLETQLRLPLFGHVTLNDIAANLQTLNPVAKERVRYYTSLYKEFVRPMLSTCRVFHHTPVIPSGSATGWCVLEYGAAGAGSGMAGLFRLAGQADPVYRFQARGLDPSMQYEVTFGNRGTAATMDGVDLMHRGLDIRVDSAVNSELLLFRAV